MLLGPGRSGGLVVLPERAGGSVNGLEANCFQNKDGMTGPLKPQEVKSLEAIRFQKMRVTWQCRYDSTTQNCKKSNHPNHFFPFKNEMALPQRSNFRESNHRKPSIPKMRMDLQRYSNWWKSNCQKPPMSLNRKHSISQMARQWEVG